MESVVDLVDFAALAEDYWRLASDLGQGGNNGRRGISLAGGRSNSGVGQSLYFLVNSE